MAHKAGYQRRQTRQHEYGRMIRALQSGEADAILGDNMIIRLDGNRKPDSDLYRLLFLSLDEPIGLCQVVYDESGQPCDFRYLEVNPAYEHRMGISPDGTAERESLEMAPELKKLWIEIYGRIVLAHKPACFRHYFPSMDRWFEVCAFWLDQHVFAGIFRDITEIQKGFAEAEEDNSIPVVRVEIGDDGRKTREELEERVRERTRELSARNLELKQRTEQLKRLTQELTQAEQRERKRLASLLHDHLQQLLVAAKFSAEGLKGDLEGSDYAPNAAETCGLINDSIQASKSLTMELCPPVLHETGLGAGLEWLAKWMHEKHGLIVNLSLQQLQEPETEEIRILLFESVRELLFNVVKHAQVREAVVEAAPCGADHLQIGVQDEGIGFDPVHLWDGSQQVSSGFGLFRVRERLGLLGGKLDIDSRLEKGSRFTIISPIRELQNPEAEIPVFIPTASSLAFQGTAAPAGQHRDRIRVLIADDHMIMRQGLNLLLNREADFIVVGEAQDGQEAVNLSERLRPDAVIMDIRMPRMGGIEATRLIRRKLPQIRILAFSNHEERDQITEILEAGASAFVHKGRRVETMLTVLRSISIPACPPR